MPTDERALQRPEGSYTTKLLEEGTAAVARKVGEEAIEVVTASLAESDERLVSESADLIYHLYVLLVSRGLDIAAVDVQNRLSQAEGRLPNEVKQVGISVQKVSTNFVLAAGRSASSWAART